MRMRFHLTIRLLHWTMAFLIIAMLFVGIGMVSTAGPAYAQLLTLHRPLGIAILLLACVRLAIRLATLAPPLPDDLPRAQKLAAKGSHLLLYLAMIGMPLIGWAMLSAGGYPVTLGLGLTLPPILPQNLGAFGMLRQAHTIAAVALFGLILGHLTIALVHGFIRHDGVLSTMAFGPSADHPQFPAPTILPRLEPASTDSIPIEHSFPAETDPAIRLDPSERQIDPT